MIRLTRINGTAIALNAEMIELVESLPDTIVTLTNGQKILVRESMDEVIERVVAYKRSILSRPLKEQES